LRAFFRKFSPGIEFTLVVGIAFGLSVYSSIHEFIAPSHMALINDRGLWSTAILEAGIMAVLLPALLLRGWRPATVGLHPNTLDTLIGLLLAVGICVIDFLTGNIIGQFTDLTPAVEHYQNLIGTHLSLPAIAVLSLVNPFYEELFLSGYIITRLRRHVPVSVAVNASVLVRLLCHLYQGPLGIIQIIPIGLCFAWWYARTGRLWPVIVAHVAWDFFPLLSYMQ
jgi:membrane protease YdiL (CAAX protease family)